jgi:hypothetical protein
MKAVHRRNWALAKLQIKLPGILILCLGVNFLFPDHALAQVWTKSSALLRSWTAIASSGDGNVLAASTGTSIYVSTNAGTAWTLTTAPAKNWTALAANGNGRILLAVASSGGTFVSTNYGNTWLSNNIPSADYDAAAASLDGSTLIVGAQIFGSVYYSTNAGVNWRSNGIPTGYWTGLACSGDGTKLAALWSGVIYTSTNSGGIWTSNNVTGTVLTCSPDGKYLFRPNGSQLNISTDWGANWYTVLMPASYTGSALGISSDAKRLVLAYNGVTAISTNFGTNWISTFGLGKTWKAAATSLDASRMAAITTTSDGIYLWTPPVLTFTNFTGTNFAVQWSTNGTPFGLQMNSDLTTSNWVIVPVAPQVTNSLNQVTVSATNSSAYFRLLAQ